MWLTENLILLPAYIVVHPKAYASLSSDSF